MARIEFWFDFASTYSYPAALRIETLAATHDIDLEWRAFLLGPVFARQGWNDSPFNLQPEKGRYMWRDLERHCAQLGIPFNKPSVFPRNGMLAARVACANAAEAWLPEFVRRVYHANFVQDRDIADAAVIGELLQELELPAASIMDNAQASGNKPLLRQQTETAISRGIFGAPMFLVGDEMFWGNDRLQDAIDWARETQRTDSAGKS